MRIALHCATMPDGRGLWAVRESFDLGRRRIIGNSLLFLFLTSVAVPSSPHASPAAPESVPGTTTVTAEELIGLAATMDDLVVIDARKPFDWNRGHIDGAVHIVNTEMTEEQLAAVARHDQPIVFYCNGPGCYRSGDASAKAVGWGWTRVYWFRGGTEEWTAKNFPLTK